MSFEVDAIVDGAKVTKDVLDGVARELGRDVVSVGRQQARGLAVELGRFTFPGGLGDGRGDNLRSRILEDIKRVFPALDDGRAGAVRIYGVLEKHDRRAAAAFWRAFDDGDRAGMEKVLSTRVKGLPRRIDQGAYRGTRTGKGGRVAKDAQALAVVRGSVRDNFIKRKEKTAGMAKAGWLHAAKALGGRVRSGGGRDGGTQATFPEWVRKAGARRKLGGAAIFATEARLKIILRNSVRHAGDAITDRLIDHAEVKARERFEKALKHSRKFVERRANGRLRKAG